MSPAAPSPSGLCAMLFAAGLGTRFKPWTDSHPKALALVNGKSLLQRNIEYLQGYGIRDVIVNVHHFPEQIESAIREHGGWGSRIRISDERMTVLETGGGLLHAERLFPAGQRFLTCNVDILTDLDIGKLMAFHEKSGALISFGVTDRKSSRKLLLNAAGQLYGWRNTLTGEERPCEGVKLNEPLQEKAYSCVVVFEYNVFQLMKSAGFHGKYSLIDVYLTLGGRYPIMGYDHSGDRLVDVGKPESVALAESLFP
ncbi:MAG: hypothetical protein RJA57_1159 [Bacteroidota bacterium]|jgi:NDP-sugar pyrophosphorylase family protein